MVIKHYINYYLLTVFRQLKIIIKFYRWTDLWLNEGFATWVGYLAVDKLFPDWEIWNQYVKLYLQSRNFGVKYYIKESIFMADMSLKDFSEAFNSMP